MHGLMRASTLALVFVFLAAAGRLDPVATRCGRHVGPFAGGGRRTRNRLALPGHQHGLPGRDLSTPSKAFSKVKGDDEEGVFLSGWLIRPFHPNRRW